MFSGHSKKLKNILYDGERSTELYNIERQIMTYQAEHGVMPKNLADLNGEKSAGYENVSFISGKDGKLETLVITHDGVDEVLPKDKIKDYDAWQGMYEDLIRKAGESKERFENDNRARIAGKS